MYFRGSSSQVCNLYFRDFNLDLCLQKKYMTQNAAGLEPTISTSSMMLVVSNIAFIFTLGKLGEDFEHMFSDGLKVETTKQMR